ncbi:MAG: gamma-glutamyl-gamma-aminobutyrate hydrolase family protein [Bacillota bacterium]
MTCGSDAEEKKYFACWDYVKALREAGGIAWLLPPHEAGEYLLSYFDGIVFTGGGDFSPCYYGDERDCRNLRGVDGERDMFEIGLMRILWERDWPALGICRGMQGMNLALGGLLYHDLSAVQLSFQDHFMTAPDHAGHSVFVEPGTILTAACGKKRLSVNSRHHQGVRRLAAGLTPAAWAEDGLLEAFNGKGKKFWLGVQWHPENLYGSDSSMLGIFQAFVKACKGTRTG